jgi:Flp pilus assembly pilin Flp
MSMSRNASSYGQMGSIAPLALNSAGSWHAPESDNVLARVHRLHTRKSILSKLKQFAVGFYRGEEGASTAEYGILIVIAAGIAIFVLINLNNTLVALFGKFGNRVNSVN